LLVTRFGQQSKRLQHVREVADEGESPATPAILVGVVLAFIVPIATVLMLLAFGAGHFSA
jgi:hypothetical protein